MPEHKCQPLTPVAPGETLLEILCERFEKESGIDLTTIERLLRGETPITESIAARLYAATGMPIHLWLNLERDYQEELNRRLEEVDAPFACDYYSDAAGLIKKWICHRGVARDNNEGVGETDTECPSATPLSTTTENMNATPWEARAGT